MNLELLKNHLHIEHCEDDDYIEMLYNAVKIQAEGYLDAVIVDQSPVEGEVAIDDAIRTAIFIGVLFIYENRGDDYKNSQSVSVQQLPSGFHALLLNKRAF